jgi:acyl-homoserine-lactone acylase
VPDTENHEPAKPNTEILWDSWGVPHIYAPDDANVFRALGWAQARAHGNLILRLYGLARGRGAEYFGEKYLESDKIIRRMGIPTRATDWVGKQTREMLTNLNAFVEGINAYTTRHPNELSSESRQVLPIRLEDVFAHIQRVYLVYLTWGGQRPAGAPFNDLIPFSSLTPDVPPMGTGIGGSNAWVLSGARTNSGQPILLANPHLYWADYFTFFEAHLNAPGLNLYGVAQVGWPVLRYGFNQRLGWAHTVNALKGWDAFELQMRGDQYVLDGVSRIFEHRQERIRVRHADGSSREETLDIHESAHGPVLVWRDNTPIAVRCVGFQAGSWERLFEQYWRMATAQNKAEFNAALAMHQNPQFTVLYADTDGNTAHHYGGFVPRRAGGRWMDYVGTLPGNDSRLIWTDVHGWNDLPRLTNPASGWMQNANNPPWTTTLDPDTGKLVLNASDFPEYLSPVVITPREQRSIRMIEDLGQASLDDVLARVGSTRSETAERLVPVLLEAARDSSSPLVQQASSILDRWDRCFDPESVGAQLFSRWLMAMQPADRILSNIWAVRWTPDDPMNTPSGLRDPNAAVRALEVATESLMRDDGTLEKPWGQVTRARRGSHEVPGHGHLDPFGVFRVTGYAPSSDASHKPVWDTAFGTTYVAAIEFTQPVRAKVLLAYGNSTQPGSPHHGDQLGLFVRREMRDAWLTRTDVEAHLEQQENV